MFAFFFSSPRIQTGCFLTPGEPLPNSTVTGLKTSNLLWVFYFQLCVVYYGEFEQNGKNFLSPDCLAYIVGSLLIFYLLTAPHWLLFVRVYSWIYGSWSLQAPKLFSQWVSHCHGQPRETEETQRSFLQGQGGVSQGSLIAGSFLPDFSILSSLDDSSTQSFYLASWGWTAPPRQLLLWEPGRS